MAPGRLLDDDDSSLPLVSRHKRPRRDVLSNEEVVLSEGAAVDEEEEAVARSSETISSPSTVPPHPLGLRPSGNAYTATRDIKAFTGHFARLPDELLLQLLEVLDPVDLVKLGGTCKALHAFCSAEDFWKTLFIEYVMPNVSHRKSCSIFIPDILLRSPFPGVGRGALRISNSLPIVKL